MVIYQCYWGLAPAPDFGESFHPLVMRFLTIWGWSPAGHYSCHPSKDFCPLTIADKIRSNRFPHLTVVGYAYRAKQTNRVLLMIVMWNHWTLKQRVEGLAYIQTAGMERSSRIILRAGIAESTISNDQKQPFLYIPCTDCHGHIRRNLEVLLSQFSPDRSQHQGSNCCPVPWYIVVSGIRSWRAEGPRTQLFRKRQQSSLCWCTHVGMTHPSSSLQE